MHDKWVLFQLQIGPNFNEFISMFQLKDKENVELSTLDIALDSSNPQISPKELSQLVLNAEIQKATTYEWPPLTNKLGVY